MDIFRRNLEITFAFLLFVLVLVLKSSVLNLPYSWDVMNYVIPAAQHIFENGFTIFLWEYGNGHPPFYFLLLGFVFKIFGNTQFIAHLVSVVFSFLAVYFTYLLGKFLFNRKVGIIASLLMFSYPTFFSYSGMSYLAMPLAAFTVMSVYLFLKGNKLLYVLISSFLVLTKEGGIFVPTALLFYRFLKNKKIDIKKDFIFGIPLLVFALWLLSNKLHYGTFLYPINSTLFSFGVANIFNGIIVLKSLFFDYFKWILASFILLCCFDFKLLRNKIKFIYSFIPSFILFLILFNLHKFSFYFSGTFPNILDYFLIMKEFSLLFSLLLFITLISINKLIIFFNNKKLYPLYLVFIFMFISYFLFIPFPARYGIPIYPIIFIIFALSLSKLFKKYSYLVVLLIIILFIFSWTGDRTNVGFVLEDNMEYVDMVKTHQMAADYLQINYPDSVILASYPQSLEIIYPYLGYVDKHMNAVSIPPFPGLTTKNSTIYLNSDRYNKTINLNEIDIIYASDQEFKTRYSIELYKILNKRLIKRFELNGKVTEIYEVEKNLNYPIYYLPLD
jgi:4-amino-4-deoxy-L-arabinose transferase-like glycosyltransferase